MMYGIIFVSILTAMVIAIATVETRPPNVMVTGWSQEIADPGGDITAHGIPKR
jgi:hypothetical protein